MADDSARSAYELLGVGPEATTQDIAAAFRQLAASFPSSQIRAAVADAYATLRDPVRRAQHDLAHGLGRPWPVPGEEQHDGLLAPGLRGVVVPEGAPGARAEVLAVDDDHVHVAMVDADDELRVGGWVDVRLGRPDDAEYRFRAHVRQALGRSYLLDQLGELERDQRRAHVRLPAVVAVAVRRPGGAEWQLARVLDLSAGGARLFSADDWAVSTRLELRLTLPYRERSIEVETEAVVVRNEGVELSRTRISGWIHGVEFVDLRPGTRDRITRAVLWAQAERRLGRDALA